jgi:hypothetical protein
MHEYSLERLAANIRTWTLQIAPRLLKEGLQEREDTVEQELWDTLPMDPNFYWNVLVANPHFFLMDPAHTGGGNDAPWEKVKDVLYTELRAVAIKELDVSLAGIAQNWPRPTLRDLRPAA